MILSSLPNILAPAFYIQMLDESSLYCKIENNGSFVNKVGFSNENRCIKENK